MRRAWVCSARTEASGIFVVKLYQTSSEFIQTGLFQGLHYGWFFSQIAKSTSVTHRPRFCQMSSCCSNIWGGHKSRQSKAYQMIGFLRAKNTMVFSCFTAETFWLKFSKIFLHKTNTMHGKFQPKQLVWQKRKQLGPITRNVCSLNTRQCYQFSV